MEGPSRARSVGARAGLEGGRIGDRAGGGGSEDQMGRWGAEAQLKVAGRGRGWIGHTKHLLALLLGAD